MSEAKHTSGPWYVEPCGVSDCWCATVVTVQHSDLMDDCVIPAGSVRKEDAHLIAAAPELLEALQSFETFHSGHVHCPEVGLLVRNARAAIAKATGAAP